MKFMIFAVCLAAVALAGCRRETPDYQPMKLGAHADKDTNGG